MNFDLKVIVIIVLINICIGLLNNTIARITEQKEKVWKFSRTRVWLRFIADTSMPPPFNLFSYLMDCVGCRKKNQSTEPHGMEMVERGKDKHPDAK